jgi:hypothetical protein
MPGKRNLAKEAANHDAGARCARIHDMLTSQLPDLDGAIIGAPSILRELHLLGVRRRNGQRVNERMLRQWRIRHGLPLLRGNWCRYDKTPAVTTHYALIAWILAQLSHGSHLGIFRIVDIPPGLDH